MNRMVKFFALVLGVLVAFSATASMLDDQKSKKPLQTVKPKSVDLKVQSFTLPGSQSLKVQFRYINEKLAFIAFRNVGKEPLEVKLFSNSYVLSDNNELSIHAPNVERLVLEVEPYVETQSPQVDALTPGKIYLFSIQSDGYYALLSSY